jgi:hypothetical protein
VHFVAAKKTAQARDCSYEIYTTSAGAGQLYKTLTPRKYISPHDNVPRRLVRHSDIYTNDAVCARNLVGFSFSSYLP